VHRPRFKHTNVDALSKNLMGPATDDDDFNEKIQDIGSIRTYTHGAEDEILSIQTGKETKWLGFRRRRKDFTTS
jgi:hypothetical protein